jgi:hypothetical protein
LIFGYKIIYIKIVLKILKNRGRDRFISTLSIYIKIAKITINFFLSKPCIAKYAIAPNKGGEKPYIDAIIG